MHTQSQKPQQLNLLPAIIFFFITMMIISSCSEEKKTVTKSKNAFEVPTMVTRDVETFISDSGITRYHITAPIWYIFEEAKVPRWTFPEGLFLEQYDNQFRQSSKIVCDSAIYFSEKRLWRLDGNIVMVNATRDSFLTRQLFWDQKAKRIYSDTSFIRIVSQKRTIEGYGFSANERISDYTIKKPIAAFPTAHLRNEENQDDTIIEQNHDTITTPQPSPTPRSKASHPAPNKKNNEENKFKLANSVNSKAI